MEKGGNMFINIKTENEKRARNNMIDCRGAYIKSLIQELGFTSYLEIGLSSNPNAPYRMIELENKTSVDMNPNTNPDFCLSSDTFFDNLNNGQLPINSNYKWEAIFIDGNHLAYQVYKDLCNAINHLSDDGIIFLHDSLPWSYDMTIENHVGNRQATCQDAWKVIEYCLKNRDDLDICTVEESGGGLGIIKKRKSQRIQMLDRDYNKFYQYCVYEKDKFKKMNCIEKESARTWILEPNVKYSF